MKNLSSTRYTKAQVRRLSNSALVTKARRLQKDIAILKLEGNIKLPPIMHSNYELLLSEIEFRNITSLM